MIISIYGKKKVVKCSKYGDTSSEMVEEEEFKHSKRISKILKNNKCQKIIALFDWLKSLDVSKFNKEK